MSELAEGPAKRMSRLCIMAIAACFLGDIGAAHPWQLRWIPNPCFGMRLQDPFNMFDSPGANTGLVFLPSRKSVGLSE
jgi:hypothetical protein